MRIGQGFTAYVPNNDRDVVEGKEFTRRRNYVAAFGKIRTSKVIRPILFTAETPLLYVWPFSDARVSHENAQRICAIAEGVYQLGRGVDMAWAWGEVVDDAEADERLASCAGVVYRPRDRVNGATLSVPLSGSLQSLRDRYAKIGNRFEARAEIEPTKRHSADAVVVGRYFVQPSRPHFRQVAYDVPSTRLLFDLVDGAGQPSSWPLDRVVELTGWVRDAAAQRLSSEAPKDAALVRSVVVGRHDASEADKAARIRIAPLPSIGHQHADRAIRRVLVEAPPNCPIAVRDLQWAFSGLAWFVTDVGEILGQLAVGAERGQLAHYGIDLTSGARAWRTVTPIALPQTAARRRIDPRRLDERAEQKSGGERAVEEDRAAAAVRHALRHAGVKEYTEAIRVQREPFETKGARAEAFAKPPRFAKERLWHAEIVFADPIAGPLIIGDGRYLGLGLMAPIRDVFRDMMVFSLPENARPSLADRTDLVRAVRRALMALARNGDGSIPALFSGHEPDGAKASSGRHRHVFLAAADCDHDGLIDEVLVAAPWACDRTAPPGRDERAQFDRVAASLATVRAGRLGVIALGRPREPAEGDALIGPSRNWESAVPYRLARHGRRGEEEMAVIRRDVSAECARRGLPRPDIEILERSAASDGLHSAVRLRLRFAVAIEGPILIGRDSHAGGGLFAATA
jgi:CRISPR-associated protein Csb2